MVAAVLVALWLCVVMPVLVVELLGRRRSSIATFEETLRGLDRSTSGALTLIGPRTGGYTTAAATSAGVREREVSKTRARRQHTVLAVGLIVVAGTLVGVAASFSRSTLALHALALQCVVAYAAVCAWTNVRRAR